MKVILLIVMLMGLGMRASLGDIPPPSKIPGAPIRGLQKGAVVSLAAYPDYMSFAHRELQQGGDFDTKAFCSATIDVGADPGVSATIEVLGVDNPSNTYETFPSKESIVLSGNESPDKDGVVRISRTIPLRHNETAFVINLTGASIRSHKNFFVNMIPLPCGAEL